MTNEVASSLDASALRHKNRARLSSVPLYVTNYLLCFIQISFPSSMKKPLFENEKKFEFLIFETPAVVHFLLGFMSLKSVVSARNWLAGYGAQKPSTVIEKTIPPLTSAGLFRH